MDHSIALAASALLDVGQLAPPVVMLAWYLDSLAHARPMHPLSPDDVNALLAHHVVGAAAPWSSRDEHVVERYLRRLCADVERACRVVSRHEWEHYGSGYASFVDAWFHARTPAFAVPPPAGSGEAYTGLVVLISRLSPFYAFAEGQKGWSGTNSHRYMPALEQVDRLHSSAVVALATRVEPLFAQHGLQRLGAAELAAPLPVSARAAAARVRTNLARSVSTHFDALFHWDD